MARGWTTRAGVLAISWIWIAACGEGPRVEGVPTTSVSSSDTETGTSGDDDPTAGPDGDATSGAMVDPDAGTSAGSGDAGDGSSTGADPSTTGEDSSTGEPMAALVFLEVLPAETILEVDLGVATDHPFWVVGHFDDGSVADVTGQVASWTTSNPGLGPMSGEVLEIPAMAAPTFESTIVTATVDGHAGAAQLTVAAYQQSGPTPDFFFVLPYLDPAGPDQKPLTFSTGVKALDVFFDMDTTVSMLGPISNLQSSLVGTVIPGVQATVPDTWFGAGTFQDFPIAPFGFADCTFAGVPGPDQPFELLAEITDVVSDVQAAVDAMSLPSGIPDGCGSDTPEAHVESLYQIATGDGLVGPGVTFVAPHAAGRGGVGFRPESMPVIVSITDAPTHDDDPGNTCTGISYDDSPTVSAVAHDMTQMYAALDSICARVVPVAVGNFSLICGPLADGRDFAEATRAIVPPQAWDLVPGGRPAGCGAAQCCTGLMGAGVATNGDGMCPLAYRAGAAGTGMDQSIVDGLSMVAAYSPFDVFTNVAGVGADAFGSPLPPGITTADFLTAVTPDSFGPIPLPGVPDPTLTPTTFENVIPDTDVTFAITAYNDIVPQLPDPQLFIATIAVEADGCYDLDERDVFILVPPAPLPDPG